MNQVLDSSGKGVLDRGFARRKATKLWRAVEPTHGASQAKESRGCPRRAALLVGLPLVNEIFPRRTHRQNIANFHVTAQEMSPPVLFLFYAPR